MNKIIPFIQLVNKELAVHNTDSLTIVIPSDVKDILKRFILQKLINASVHLTSKFSQSQINEFVEIIINISENKWKQSYYPQINHITEIIQYTMLNVFNIFNSNNLKSSKNIISKLQTFAYMIVQLLHKAEINLLKCFSAEPTAVLAVVPTTGPTAEATTVPTAEATTRPTAEATAEPTAGPTAESSKDTKKYMEKYLKYKAKYQNLKKLLNL